MAAVESPRSGSRISTPPTSARAALPEIRVGEDGFVAEAAVDAWVRAGVAARVGCSLTAHDGRRFLLRDAVRVLGRRNSDTDPYGFTGRVDALRELIRRGVTISADSLRLGQAVYDIEYGFIATPAEVGARMK